MEMADHKIYKKLSKNKKMNTCSGVLFKVFFQKFVLMLSS